MNLDNRIVITLTDAKANVSVEKIEDLSRKTKKNLLILQKNERTTKQSRAGYAVA